MTEIIFGCDVVGVGREWHIITGWTDEEMIRRLRSVQYKSIGFIAPVIRDVMGTMPPPE